MIEHAAGFWLGFWFNELDQVPNLGFTAGYKPRQTPATGQ